MKRKEEIFDVSAELEREFGPKGSETRKQAEDKAWEEYNAQILLDARKNGMYVVMNTGKTPHHL